MEFNGERIDQTHMFQACQKFIEQQQRPMLQEVQDIFKAKDNMIDNLNKKINEAYEILKVKHKRSQELQLRQDELEFHFGDITAKNVDLKKELKKSKG